MSLFKDIQNRQIQRKSNNFIKSLENKSEKEIEQAYLDNKEFENNEIVLSHLFFKYPNLIRILPVDFQKSRLNSNLKMFNYGSNEAKKELVSEWLSQNKFFMNSLAVDLDDSEFNNYIRMYFKQPKDVAKLHMDDLRRVIKILSDADTKETENVIQIIKNELTDRQWEFIIEVNPLFIKYASQAIQNKYSDDEKYNLYINSEAREIFVKNQIDKIKADSSLLNSAPIDVQKEYIHTYPYMINYIDDNTLIELLKYDIDLIKYVNMPSLKNKDDKSLEVIYGILDNVENKSIKEIINIFVNKGVLNARGKLFRFDSKSNNTSYQYTRRMIKIIQSLSLEQMTSLITIDVNYVLPYVVPLYNDDSDRKLKESVIIDCNSRCLNLFKYYYGEEIYSKYYKVINKIFNEYLANIEKYDYSKDYNCILDLLKVLFNKKIIKKNNTEKITVFIGMSLLYKGSDNPGVKPLSIKLLNELLSVAYDKDINNNSTIYDLNCLEIFDDRLSFIPEDLLYNYAKFNFVNMSSLLFVVKTDKVRKLFEKYFKILTYIYSLDKSCLFKAVESFNYNYDILKNIDGLELNDKEIDNLIELLASFNNQCNITKREELSNYDMILLKKMIKELSTVKDENLYKNLLCNYLYNKGYDQKGNTGWLEVDTIKQIFDIYDVNSLKELEIDGNKVFTLEEINLFKMTKLLFSESNMDLLLSFIENIINNKVKRNILSVIDFFNKIKKYRIELINSQIVGLLDIEALSIDRPSSVKKNYKDGVLIYTIVGQDFKVLCSENDDGIHYICSDVSKLEKNSYGYSKLIKENNSVRFTTFEDKTIVKMNKDNKTRNHMKPEFILVVGRLTDELLSIAKNNDLKIVEVLEG